MVITTSSRSPSLSDMWQKYAFLGSGIFGMSWHILPMTSRLLGPEILIMLRAPPDGVATAQIVSLLFKGRIILLFLLFASFDAEKFT